MTWKVPHSKSSATVAARKLRAMAADLRNAAAGFEQAAVEYQSLDPVFFPSRMKTAYHTADGSFELAAMALRVWKDRV